MNVFNSNFSFKFVDKDQIFKEIKKLHGNKAIITSVTPYLTPSFQVN